MIAATNIDWDQVKARQAELFAIVRQRPKQLKYEEAASDALFFFVENPNSEANPSGVFRNCLRDIERSLLR